jgi:endonuclease/exonuclease/phosphatase (EEP) superfamily protein YafD
MRWPLDHVYVSEEFRVMSFRKLNYFGSDHFPIYVALALPDIDQ